MVGQEGEEPPLDYVVLGQKGTLGTKDTLTEDMVLSQATKTLIEEATLIREFHIHEKTPDEEE